MGQGTSCGLARLCPCPRGRPSPPPRLGLVPAVSQLSWAPGAEPRLGQDCPDQAYLVSEATQARGSFFPRVLVLGSRAVAVGAGGEHRDRPAGRVTWGGGWPGGMGPWMP